VEKYGIDGVPIPALSASAPAPNMLPTALPLGQGTVLK